ncbi:phage antirepressor [Brevibacillus formosus]|uniref:phage antirepressor n=1 Tax=Brevibacillus formosus TaxID=54913 RepID=UPI003F1B803F
MSQLQSFNHPMFGELPVIVADGVEWFGATEAAKALSFSNPYTAIPNHVDSDDLSDQEVIDKLGRTQQKKFINESGLYSLIFGAAKQGNNPEIKERAKKFKRWVTSEVLPAVRKHGAYMTPETIEKTFSDPDFIIRVATKLKEEQQKTQLLQKKIEEDKPKVIFANAVATSKTSILVREMAKILKQNGVCIGQNRFFGWLRENGYLIKRKGTDYNMPTQKSMELGLFEIKETSVSHSDGHITISKTPKVTGKGQLYFVNKFRESA